MEEYASKEKNLVKIRNKTLPKHGLMGQFILTGSSTPSDGEIAHSGTGRIARMLMRPMSLFKSDEYNGKVAIKDLFEGNTDIAAKSTLSLEQIAHSVCRGELILLRNHRVDKNISSF